MAELSQDDDIGSLDRSFQRGDKIEVLYRMAFPEDGGRERIELVEAFNCCKACWTASSSLAKPQTPA